MLFQPYKNVRPGHPNVRTTLVSLSILANEVCPGKKTGYPAIGKRDETVKVRSPWNLKSILITESAEMQTDS